MTKHLLALDPGRSKIGVAVLNYQAQELEKTIVSKEDLIDHLSEIFNKYQPAEIVIGNGTGAEIIISLIENNFDQPAVKEVAEAFTTEAAQQRYLAEKPMSNYEKILRKFIDWKVTKALDDYAALIIGEKYLKKLDKNSAGTYNND